VEFVCGQRLFTDTLSLSVDRPVEMPVVSVEVSQDFLPSILSYTARLTIVALHWLEWLNFTFRNFSHMVSGVCQCEHIIPVLEDLH